MKNIVKQTLSGIIEISRGMFTIAKHAFRPAITLEYPEKKPKLNSRFHGKVALLTKEDGSDVCIGCGSCAKVCPCGDLIQIETSRGEDKKIKVEKFTIDIGRCIFCGNCASVCPVTAIILTNEYELADFSREACVLDKEKLKLTPEESVIWKDRLEKDI